MLFHPLDWLGADEVRELGFFPGMQMSVARKLALLGETLAQLADDFTLETLGTQAARLNAPGRGGQQRIDVTQRAAAVSRQWAAIPIRGAGR
jgi:hypothetical protein